MDASKCPRCDAARVAEPECPQCGVVYAKADAAEQKKEEARLQALRDKMAPCKTCGVEISKNAPTCPHCGEPLKAAPAPPAPPPLPALHPSWAKKAPQPPIRLGCLGFLAIILFAGYLIGEFSGPSTSTTAAEKTAASAPKTPVATAPKIPVERTRGQKIQDSFSGWNGSHIKLTRVIKAGMNDPKSYDHIRTSHVVAGDTMVVTAIFRGKNAFGALIINKVVARVDLDGNVLEIISQGAP